MSQTYFRGQNLYQLYYYTVNMFMHSIHEMLTWILMNVDCIFSVVGIKEYSNWPTIPQVYFSGEFVGGCDIMLDLHKSGELIDELEKLGIRSALLDTPDKKAWWRTSGSCTETWLCVWLKRLKYVHILQYLPKVQDLQFLDTMLHLLVLMLVRNIYKWMKNYSELQHLLHASGKTYFYTFSFLRQTLFLSQ